MDTGEDEDDGAAIVCISDIKASYVTEPNKCDGAWVGIIIKYRIASRFSFDRSPYRQRWLPHRAQARPRAPHCIARRAREININNNKFVSLLIVLSITLRTSRALRKNGADGEKDERGFSRRGATRRDATATITTQPRPRTRMHTHAHTHTHTRAQTAGGHTQAAARLRRATKIAPFGARKVE